MITVSIIEDEPKYAKILSTLINAEDGMQCISIFPNIKKARKECLQDNADIIIMDIQLPDGSGIDLVREFKKERPDKKIVMCTTFDDDEKIFQSLKNGASGYLIKDESLENIVSAIRDLDSVGAPMSKSIALKVIQHFHALGKETEGLHQLTKRENQLLGLLSKGKFYKEVAYELEISLETVKKHAGNIYRKLEVSNKTEAINLYTKK